MSNSIAIITDAINNLSDALSSIITVIGTKLAGKAPDRKHPYGYGRIEYMTAFIVSAIVLYLGFVHIEVLDTLTVANIDKIPRRITKSIMEKYGVILHTVGIYSINAKDNKAINTRKDIEDIVFSHQGILQMHGFYMDDSDKTISFDIIIDFAIPNREELYQHIYDEVQSKYKDYALNITLDLDAND